MITYFDSKWIIRLLLLLVAIPFIASAYRSCDYDSEGRVRSIHRYSTSPEEGGRLVSIERFDRHPIFSDLLVERTLEDAQGNLLIDQTSFYNDSGELIEEHYRDYTLSTYSRHSLEYQEDGNRIRRITIENRPASTHEIACYASADKSSSSFASFEHAIYEEKDFFSRMSGYNADPGEIGIYEGEELDNVRITFINGVLNTKSDALVTARWLSESHGGVSIHYIFNPTGGWAWDLLKSTSVRWGIVSDEALSVAQLWKKLIEEMGGPESEGTIIHYAHSIGACHTYAAKSLMTPEELKMIRLYTFGSPTIIPPDDFQLVLNYIGVRDGVGLMDIFGRIKAWIYDCSHIIYVGSYLGIPFIDHLIQGGSYHLPIETLGKEFLEHFKNRAAS